MIKKNFLKDNWLKFLVIFLIFLNILTVVFFLYRKETIVNKYPYIDFSRNFIDQEHYITTLQPLRENLVEMAKEFGNDSVSIYIEDLNTGSNISINQDKYIWPASLTKLPLALAVVKKIEDGQWKLSNELVLMKGDIDSNSGDVNNLLSKYPLGTTFTIEKLLQELLTNSDNTAYFILKRNMHQDELYKVVEDLGLDKLFSDNGRLSAKEYSRLFRSLYTANFLSRENSQMILEMLDASIFNDFITYGLFDLVKFPHKYGENDQLRAYSDSGIVYVPNRPYIISVMIQGDEKIPLGVDKEKATVFMREISNVTYDYISKVKK